jgi:hypothetical protein
MSTDDRCPLVKTDPVIGLPKGARWVEELGKRLEDGSFRGDRAHLDKQ